MKNDKVTNFAKKIFDSIVKAYGLKWGKYNSEEFDSYFKDDKKYFCLSTEDYELVELLINHSDLKPFLQVSIPFLYNQLKYTIYIIKNRILCIERFTSNEEPDYHQYTVRIFDCDEKIPEIKEY